MGCENSSEKHQPRIIVLGMGGAGKTTIVYQLKNKKFINALPTYGFLNEKIKFDEIIYDIWDLGGQDKIRPQWGPYYKGAKGIIFVIDSADSSLLKNAKKEIFKAVQDYRLKNVPFLVFANKQDIEGALTKEQLIKQLNLEKLIDERYYDAKENKKIAMMHDLNKSTDPLDPSRKCFVNECCAINNNGIEKGMRWLASAIKYRADILQ